METTSAPAAAQAPHISGKRPPSAQPGVSQAAAVSSGLRPSTLGERVGRPAKLWLPKRVFITAAAAEEAHGRRILARLEALGAEVTRLKTNRLPPLTKGLEPRAAYRAAKDTLAIVNAPAGQLKLQPIPPSADYQFHLAKGCPAHCQYCYLAGSLPGAPITRVYANLDAILDNVAAYAARGTAALKRRPADAHRHPEGLTFEASCYTDPLGLEHLTGSLSTAVSAFAKTPGARLRWVTKYDNVDPLIGLEHGGRTRCRVSLNAALIARRLEGGTADLPARLHALRRLALPRAQGGGGYPVGAVLAPLMPFPQWRTAYAEMLDGLERALDFASADCTFELITHRFTPGSKQVLLDWYPATKLDMDESRRSEKRNKFGGKKYVYDKQQMLELKGWFGEEIDARFGPGKLLYFT